MITYSFYTHNDLDDISALLKENKLPYQDIHTSKVHFIIARNEGQVVGCIGLEHYGTEGLLRSFAVAQTFQNKGYGKALYNKLIDYCAKNGIKTLHLLTNTASEYFLKNGFSVKNRINAPYVIQETMEFKNLCPSSSTYMIKQLSI
jgi:amino-acid N-acetyltransferase